MFFPERLKKLELHSFVLGNEITNEDASKGKPKEAEKIRELMKKDKLFAMVGTIEPRKGHEELLKVFDVLWNAGHEVAIVFIGKRGWEVDNLVEEIKNHKMLGRHLFWLENCSDEFLLEVYSEASGLVVSSRAEGYSLPIVESQFWDASFCARYCSI